jgi:hypothetical protein
MTHYKPSSVPIPTSISEICFSLVILDETNQHVNTASKPSTKRGSNPVNPVRAYKSSDDSRPEAARRVQATTGEEDTADLGGEESKADIHWLRGAGRQHKHNENQLRCHEHLEK